MSRYRLTTFRVSLEVQENTTQTLTTSQEAETILRALYRDLDADQEHFAVLTLGADNKVTGFKILASGMMSSAQVDMKLLFRALVELGTPSFIVAHNHPSGEPRPSQADRNITEKITQAAKLMDYTFLDHIILAPHGYYSFNDDGKL